jgi:hypothetical protein
MEILGVSLTTWAKYFALTCVAFWVWKTYAPENYDSFFTTK